MGGSSIISYEAPNFGIATMSVDDGKVLVTYELMEWLLDAIGYPEGHTEGDLAVTLNFYEFDTLVNLAGWKRA